jgi:hypothetical protein
MSQTLLTKEERQKKYLVAFSGGPDSVYLLFRLAQFYRDELKKHVALVYINYHDSSFVDKEEEIVSYYQNKYQLKLYRKDVTFWKYKKINFEEWARNYRYQYFAKIIKEENYHALLTGHQLTDHVETYLLQKKRNNLPLFYGLKRETTLKGMTVLRPLLDISKRSIIEKLNLLKLPYYDDITNHDLLRARNNIRNTLEENDLIPCAEEISQKNKELGKLYEFFASYPHGMEFSTYNRFTEEEKKRYCFFLLDSLKIHQSREGCGKNMFIFLKKQGNQVLKLSDKYVLYRLNDRFFTSFHLDSLSYSYTYKKPGIYHNKFFSIDLRDLSRFNFKSFPVTIRNNVSGDIIDTDLGVKEVTRFLQRQDVPSYMKHLYPVFLIDGKIKEVPFLKDIKEKKSPLQLNYLHGIHH